MSDEGKRWYKVTGLAAGDAYTVQASESEARCAMGQSYLDAEPIPAADAIAHFEQVRQQLQTKAQKG
jgi:hypothetical protein